MTLAQSYGNRGSDILDYLARAQDDSLVGLWGTLHSGHLPDRCTPKWYFDTFCGGWDEKDGGSVYSIPLGGTLVKQPYAVGGSGSTFIYGLLDAEFKENMTRDECMKFVRSGECF